MLEYRMTTVNAYHPECRGTSGISSLPDTEAIAMVLQDYELASEITIEAEDKDTRQQASYTWHPKTKEEYPTPHEIQNKFLKLEGLVRESVPST